MTLLLSAGAHAAALENTPTTAHADQQPSTTLKAATLIEASMLAAK